MYRNNNYAMIFTKFSLNIEKYKARLVMRGFNNLKHMDQLQKWPRFLGIRTERDIDKKIMILYLLLKCNVSMWKNANECHR